MNLNQVHREPDFENIRLVLNCQEPTRLPLFEFFMNPAVYEAVAGPSHTDPDQVVQLAYMIKAYASCGYDYVNTAGCDLHFPAMEEGEKETLPLNRRLLSRTGMISMYIPGIKRW